MTLPTKLKKQIKSNFKRIWYKMAAPAPVVTGISPNEATPGTKITIRGENFGLISSDILGINILGKFWILIDLRSFKEKETVLAQICWSSWDLMEMSIHFMVWFPTTFLFPSKPKVLEKTWLSAYAGHSATENSLASSLWTYFWWWSYYIFFSCLIGIWCLLNFLTSSNGTTNIF